MREITFTVAAREALAEEMARQPNIFVVGEGIGVRGGNFNTTLGLYDLYGPMRLRDTPIVERGFVGMCAGAAMTGARPVVDFMFFDFILDSMGELINQIAKMQYMSSGRLKMPIVLRGCIGIGGASATHHSGNYYPIFVHIPGIRVVLPSNPYDAKGLFKTALCGDDPVIPRTQIAFEHQRPRAGGRVFHSLWAGRSGTRRQPGDGSSLRFNGTQNH
jgi:2-oxoisovalerate dehydrogenase E1 component